MLTDADLLARLPNFEDHFIERKPNRDSRDWKKTLVCFANSAVVGYPAVLFIGVRPDGTIEDGIDADQLSIEFSNKTADVYPPVHYVAKALAKDGKPFLAVIVPGSEQRPHFAGRSYVRDGSQTKVASETQFNELIAQRNSKTREILKWKGMLVMIGSSSEPGRRPGRSSARVVDCNQFFVTLGTGSPETLISAPLVDLDISLDHTTSPASLMLLFNQTRW
jgi:hypothetical protein